MAKFSIPVVVQVKADTVEEAEAFVKHFLRCGCEDACNHEPKTFKAIRRYNFAEIQIRPRKPE